MPLSREDLAAACSTNDRAVDAGGSIPMLLMGLHVDPASAVYVAEQRALRIALLASGVPPADFPTATYGSLSIIQRELIPVYAGAWLDGLATALRAEFDARA